MHSLTLLQSKRRLIYKKVGEILVYKNFSNFFLCNRANTSYASANFFLAVIWKAVKTIMPVVIHVIG